ncbi:TPR repeat-containing protein [Chitinophaga ginsengisegetis]|uniref:TPR repeat-containing protein n=1 Tax=Chitinophaga ginsengisegetis TaxID=393003 RepID=A0A1T5P7U2_9BACT|nr:tetratricopeptide repeat protein [Chitinophaga ginsengisegetis]MDR6567672.1 Tfp pilus assembly protein PilF [Chitinophaga ginsengisegetis]MDR6647773.1 Tfp pilus assembly protein PilF [Chitinophaga ginsengisegetis]MDR6654123.1 Tfp pilus assembly protein PilF [Chitinophaga ginsengisegetis]SKD08633.1 TPR repeat-containing protein [Chitinophaga ginsengisegetis]
MDRIAQIKQFLAATPNDSFLKHALALEYIKLNDDVTARQLFEELLAHEPGYVGSYYHLGKLLERAGDNAAAISTYEKGMAMAKAGNERHAYNELQSAYEDLVY